MYKLLIVDDENLVRVAFRTMVDYEACGFSICGTAADGEEALQVCAQQDPDLIITDIKMPHMDGITLIERLNEQGFTGKIVLISNYDDFELVRRGMVLGAQDYLLKLTITTQQYTDMLLRMKKALDETVRRRRQDELARTAIDQLTQRKQAAFWQALLTAKTVNEGDVPPQLFSEGPLDLFFIQILQYGQVMKVSSQKDMDLLNYALLNVAAELLGPKVLTLGSLTEGRYFVVTPTAAGQPQNIAFLAQKLCTALTQYLNVTVAVVYEAAIKNQQALLLAHSRLALLPDRLFYAESSAAIPFSELREGGSWDVNLPQFTGRLCERLRCADLPGAVAAAEEQLALCRSAGASRDELLHKWSAVLLRLGERLEGFLPVGGAPVPSRQLAAATDLAQLKTLVEGFLPQLCAQLRPENNTPGAHEVERILQYIHTHIHEKISLAQLARQVNFNETYLCTVFRANTGTSIVNYINQTKMERAAEQLLQSDLLLKNLAADLGFSDQFYFNKMFRKYYGMSPSDYRKKQQEITNAQ